jgi:hypothetical protein
MSKYEQAFLSFSVRKISASEGLRLPLGWLCDKMIFVAAVFSATDSINLTSTTVPVMPPTDNG